MLSSQKIAIYICILALAVLVNQTAEVRAKATDSPGAAAFASATSSGGGLSSMFGVFGSGNADAKNEAEGDEEYMPEDDSDEYEDDYADGSDEVAGPGENVSPEQNLSELVEDHYSVRQDCLYYKQSIDEAKQAGNSTIDPELLQTFTECKQTLNEIETDMRQLTDQIFNDKSLLES